MAAITTATPAAYAAAAGGAHYNYTNAPPAPTAPSPPSGGRYSPRATYTLAPMTTSSPPSADVSPTDSQAHLKYRQIRPPRQPLYVPAALRPSEPVPRPTDIPARPYAPDTPPASVDNSFDSGKVSDSPSPLAFAPGAGAGGTGGDGSAPQSRDGMDRGLYGGLASAAAGADGDDFFADAVTGPPTTAHWKPDSAASVCSVCQAAFTWFFRRHHCRRCGNLVCDTHIKHAVPLDQNARLHPKGTPSKACTPCWDAWKLVKKSLHSRAGSVASSDRSSSHGTAVPIPTANAPAKPSRDAERVGSMARSAEGMVWSTF